MDQKILTALSSLGLARDAQLDALVSRERDDPVAKLLLQLAVKVAGVTAEVAEARKAAKQVAEAEAKWDVVGVARGQMIFLDGRGRNFSIPRDLAKALGEGADLDATVTFEYREGLPFTVFHYAGRKIEIPSSLLRKIAPPGGGGVSPARTGGTNGASRSQSH